MRYAPFILALCALYLPVAAAQETDSLRAYELDPVVVTGTRIPTQKSRLPASISVITRAEIEASGASNALPAAAQHVPGLFLQERATTGFGVAPGSGGTVSIRGLSGTPNTRVLMLIDGQPQFMGLFGHPISDAYMASDIERIEVVRGPASVLYGSNAMAGAINLITRHPPDEGFSATLRSSYGSYGTRQYGGSMGYRQGAFAAFASLNHERTDGVRNDRDDSFRMLAGYLKLAYQASPHYRITADGTLSDARFHDPGPVTAETAPPDAERDYLRGRAAFSVDNTYEQIEGALRFFYSFGEHDFSGGFASADVNAGATFYQNVRLGEQRVLTLGADYKTFGGEAATSTPGGHVTLVDERLGELDIYALLQQRLLGALELSAGVRRVHNTRYGAEWVPGFGATYWLTPATTLKGSVAKGFRSPALVDLFIGPVANADLEPERLWNVELGLTQDLFARALRLEATAFRSRAHNLIQVVGGPGRAPQRQNAADLTHTGFELQVDYTPRPRLHLAARYAYLHLDAPLLLAPAHDLYLRTTYRLNRAELQLGGHWVDDLYTMTENDGVRQSYFLLNARLAVRLLAQAHVFVEGKNLLDRAYQIDYGYPMPGRAVFAGVRVRL